MKIIIWALSGIGDALMFTPALNLLRKKYPDAIIDVVVMYKGSYDIFKDNVNINNLYHFDFLKEGIWKSLKFIYHIANKYDVSINVYPSNRVEYNIINLMTLAKQRLAVKYLREDFINFGFFNNKRILEDDKKHNVVENIDLLAEHLNIPKDYSILLEFYTNNDAKNIAQQFIDKIGKDNLIIGMHPGCNTLKNHDKRRWDVENFGLLAKKIIEEFESKILLFGGPEEKYLREKILEIVNSENCVSVENVDLSTSYEIIKNCDYFVTNDSSLMHVASAAKVFVFPIIGPTNLNYIHPWQTEYMPITLNLECSPCFYYSPKPLTCNRLDKKFKCVKDLTVDFAFNIIKEIIEKRGKRCQR